MMDQVIEHPARRARRRRREAEQRRDECVAFAMNRKSDAAQRFWLWIADTQDDEARRQLRRVAKWS
jgi:hypothetical protein